MPDVTLAKRKVADRNVTRLREWLAEIRNRENETIETLQDQAVHLESGSSTTSTMRLT